MKTGVPTSTIIRFKKKIPPGKNCIKCPSFRKGYCKEFHIRITDTTNARVCSKYKGTINKNKRKRTNKMKDRKVRS